MENNIKTIIVATINKNKDLDKNMLCHKIEIELVNGILARNTHIPMDDISAIYDEVMNPIDTQIVEETPITEEV